MFGRSARQQTLCDTYISIACSLVDLIFSQMFCPNPACSELVEMPNPSDAIQAGRCPRCASVICARCRVLWHKSEESDFEEYHLPSLTNMDSDLSCEEYRSKRTAMTDPQLGRLIKRNQWCRCPNCKVCVSPLTNVFICLCGAQLRTELQVIVEKTSGCRHMRCICKWEFCYRCGNDWDVLRGMCGSSTPCRVHDEDDGRRRREFRW